MVKFAHVVAVVEETLERTNLEVAKVTVGCESIQALPAEIKVVIGKNQYTVNIRVTAKLDMPPSNDRDSATEVQSGWE